MSRNTVHPWLLVSIVVILCEKRLASESDADILSVSVDSKGDFILVLAGKPWLKGGGARIRCNGSDFDSTKGSVTVTKVLLSKGNDNHWGPYNETAITWTTSQSSDTAVLMTIFRVFSEYPIVVFEQQFLTSCNESSSHDFNMLLSAFPSFETTQGVFLQGIWLAFRGGQAPPFSGGQLGAQVGNCKDFETTYPHGIPLVLYENSTTEVTVISPLNNFQSSAQVVDASTHRLEFGLDGKVTSIPFGFAHGTVLVAGSLGVQDTMNFWGVLMRQRYDRQLTSSDSDVSLSHLGYWTDNGAAYYYRKEGNKTFADTLLDVKSDADRLRLPFRYFQLDSFWYLKGNSSADASCKSGGSGLVDWRACEDEFPGGIETFQRRLALPIVSHSRWLAPGCVYRNRMPFIVDRTGSIPAKPYDFFNYLFSTAKTNWNLVVYEQDWLGKIYESSTVLQTDLNAEQAYYQEMGQAAGANGLSVAYGTIRGPTDVLMALTVPTATFVFSSPNPSGSDRIDRNWRLSVPSLLVYNVGMVPMKDTFRSTTSQPGTTFPNNALHAAVALLSLGPVGPSDAIGHSDAALLQSLCMTDGRLLRPSRPCLSMDQAMAAPNFTGELCNTYADVSVWETAEDRVYRRWHYVLSAALASDLTVSLAELSPRTIPRSSDSFVSYAFDVTQVSRRSSVVPFDSEHPLHLPSKPSQLMTVYAQLTVIAPLLPGGWAVLGETDKMVPVSEQRFHAVSSNSTSLHVSLSGVDGESCSVQIYNKNVVSIVNCKIKHDTTANVICIILNGTSYNCSC